MLFTTICRTAYKAQIPLLRQIRNKPIIQVIHGQGRQVSRPTLLKTTIFPVNACRVGKGLLAAKIGVMYGMCHSIDDKSRETEIAIYLSIAVSLATLIGLLVALGPLGLICFIVFGVVIMAVIAIDYENKQRQPHLISNTGYKMQLL